jgi:hypothetical protein
MFGPILYYSKNHPPNRSRLILKGLQWLCYLSSPPRGSLISSVAVHIYARSRLLVVQPLQSKSSIFERQLIIRTNSQLFYDVSPWTISPPRGSAEAGPMSSAAHVYGSAGPIRTWCVRWHLTTGGAWYSLRIVRKPWPNDIWFASWEQISKRFVFPPTSSRLFLAHSGFT